MSPFGEKFCLFITQICDHWFFYPMGHIKTSKRSFTTRVTSFIFLFYLKPFVLWEKTSHLLAALKTYMLETNTINLLPHEREWLWTLFLSSVLIKQNGERYSILRPQHRCQDTFSLSGNLAVKSWPCFWSCCCCHQEGFHFMSILRFLSAIFWILLF